MMQEKIPQYSIFVVQQNHGHWEAIFLARNFSSNIRNYLVGITRLFKKIFSDAHCDPQYNYCSHTPRKTAGKMLYEHGMKVWEVSKFLGHTDARQTLCYIGMTNKKVKDMHNILSDILE